MREAAVAFLTSLDAAQSGQARAAFETPDHREWTYLPGPRPGLALADMTAPQRDLALALLDTGLSAGGARTARDIMLLDDILRDIERDAGRPGWERRHRHHYWVRVLGDPAADEVWAWRVTGHHLAVHLTVVGDGVAATPQFFGANPALVPHGAYAGRRTLPQEEHLGRALVTALDATQRARALTATSAPRDIKTRQDPLADPAVVDRGLAATDMDPGQRDLLEQLVRHYLGRVAPEVAEPSWDAAARWMDQTSFTWQGGLAPGDGHYYAVVGPTFLLEYDNVQGGANHIHSVWRDLHHDWGRDLLAEHYSAHPH